MSENQIFSYTKRDYETSRTEGLAQIPSLSKGRWTDLNATDPGIIILDYVHALVDMINFYQDHQALETFLVTAKERVNIFRIAKHLSYKVRSAKGATCEVKFKSMTTYDHPILIPKYTKLSTEKKIVYYTTEDAYLQSGKSEVSVVCTQGELSSIKYVGTGISRYSDIANATDQTVLLTDTNIDIDTITITDSLGILWEPVDYIAYTREGEKVYQADLTYNNNIIIRFGDGERGFVPRETDTLTINYVVTQADSGKINANELVHLNSLIVDDGKYVELSVSNTASSTGGTSVQTSASIKELAPGIIKSQYRAVTLEDFEYLATYIDGVAGARADDINTDSTILHHEVKVTIIPENLDSNLEILKNKVYNYLYDRMIPPTNLIIKTPVYSYVNLDITVKAFKEEATPGQLEYRIHKVIEEYFEEKSKNLGETFQSLNLSTRLYNIDNVKDVENLTYTISPSVSNSSIIRLGTLSLTIV